VRYCCLLLAFLSFTIAWAQSEERFPKGYVCQRTTQKVVVDGRAGQSEEWSKAAWTDYFVDIEGDAKPAPFQQTRVKMMWDDTYFYFFAELEETDLWATLTEHDQIIYYDNDFEIFLDPDGDSHQYFEFEVNAFNTVFDLFLVKTYRSHGPNLNSWNFKGLKSAVQMQGTLNMPEDRDTSWTVEVAIPWASIENVRYQDRMPKVGDYWRVNFSRVHYDLIVKGEEYQKKKNSETGKPMPEYNWVWSPQGAINMHLPQFWGGVLFSDASVGTTESYQNPPEEHIRQWLYELHDRQWRYHRINKVWLTDQKVWFKDAPEWWQEADYTLNQHGNRWQISLPSQEKPGTWIVQEDGRCGYFEPMPIEE